VWVRVVYDKDFWLPIAPPPPSFKRNLKKFLLTPVGGLAPIELGRMFCQLKLGRMFCLKHLGFLLPCGAVSIHPAIIQERNKCISFLQEWNGCIPFLQEWNGSISFLQEWNGSISFLWEWNERSIPAGME
jgi:hypothetical protein